MVNKCCTPRLARTKFAMEIYGKWTIYRYPSIYVYIYMYVGNLCHSYETCEPLVSTVCIISMVMFHSKLLNDHRANAYDDIFLFTSRGAVITHY